MKKIFYILLAFITAHACGQGTYFNVTHVSGTVHTACTDITVTSNGIVGSSPFGCGLVGATYLIATTYPTTIVADGSYTWTYVPGANAVRFNILALDSDEYVRVSVNGVHVDFNLLPSTVFSTVPLTCLGPWVIPHIDPATGDLYPPGGFEACYVDLSAALLSVPFIDNITIECIQDPYGAGINAQMQFEPGVTPIAPITGPSTLVCTGSDITMSDASAGGTWASADAAIATVTSGTGIVHGVAAGTVVITYTAPGGCYTTASVTVADGSSPCSPCSQFHAPYTTLTGGTITSSLSAGNYHLTGDLYVDAFLEFDDAVILIDPGVQIFVTQAGLLTMKGCHLYCCDGMWKGILLLPGSTVTGKAQLLGSAAHGPTLIEDALVAVQLKTPTGPAAAYNLINSNNAVFNRNNVGIQIEDYTHTFSSFPASLLVYEFHVENTVFTSRDFHAYPGWPEEWPNTVGTPGALKNIASGITLYDPPYYGTYHYPFEWCHNLVTAPHGATAGIVLSNVGPHSATIHTGVEIGAPSTATTIPPGIVNTQLNLFDNLSFGIKATNANLTIHNSSFVQMMQTPPAAADPHEMGGEGIYAVANNGIRYNVIAEPSYYTYVAAGTHTTTSINLFYDCKYGLYAVNYNNVTGKNCFMTTTQSNAGGISPVTYGYDIQAARYENINMSNNEIVNVANGISLKMLTGTPAPAGWPVGQATIYKNKIMGSFGATAGTHYVDKGIWVDNAISYLSTGVAPLTQVNVDANMLSNVYNGIYINGVSVQPATTNNDTVLGIAYPAGAGPAQYGIWHAVCLYDQVKNCVVTGTNPQNLNWNGIKISNDFFHTVRCNSVTNVGKGFEFASTVGKSVWEGNTMTNTERGFSLTGAGTQIGLQGLRLASADNKWKTSGSFTWGTPNYQTFTTLASPINSPMWVRNVTLSGVVYDPVANFSNPFLCSRTYGCTGGIISGSGNGLSYAALFYPAVCFISSPWDNGNLVNNVEMAMIASKEIQDAGRDHNWMAQYTLWRCLLQNPWLDGFATHNSFKTGEGGCRYGLLTDVENKLAAGDYAQANALLNNYALNDLANGGVYQADSTDSAANNIVGHYRDFYRLYIKYEDSTLTGTDSTAIEAMATLCPVTEGEVVYKARALYDIVYDTLRIFESNCDSVLNDTLDRAGQNTDNGNNWNIASVSVEGQKYVLYPNPNDGNFTIEQTIADKEPIWAEAWDVTGRSVYKEQVQFRRSTLKIVIKDVAGTYMLVLTDGKGRVFKFKFTIE